MAKRSGPTDLVIAAALALPMLLPARPLQAREVVDFPDYRYQPGTILIRTGERKLYFIAAPGQALRYTIAVGKAGKQWRGVKYVEELVVEPAWSPPAEVKRDNPRLPDVIPGERRTTRWVRASSASAPAANTRSTAPTTRARSAPPRPMAVSACTTAT